MQFVFSNLKNKLKRNVLKKEVLWIKYWCTSDTSISKTKAGLTRETGFVGEVQAPVPEALRDKLRYFREVWLW